MIACAHHTARNMAVMVTPVRQMQSKSGFTAKKQRDRLKPKLRQANMEASQIYFANCNFCVSCKRLSDNFSEHLIFINELFSLIKNHRCQHSFGG
jgi:hypothetical protein